MRPSRAGREEEPDAGGHRKRRADAECGRRATRVSGWQRAQPADGIEQAERRATPRRRREIGHERLNNDRYLRRNGATRPPSTD
jgi:hypothetical protein